MEDTRAYIAISHPSVARNQSMSLTLNHSAFLQLSRAGNFDSILQVLSLTLRGGDDRVPRR
jgi:hypothetical protein